LAAEKSKDPSKSEGGELDWSPASGYVKPFADAMVALKKGEYTKEPVQSQFGWHVIRLDDIRSMPPPAFEQIKQQLAQHMQQQMVEKAITDLRAKAKVE
jgi:peptidyl-prolyl cis-trans isomerase C